MDGACANVFVAGAERIGVIRGGKMRCFTTFAVCGGEMGLCPGERTRGGGMLIRVNEWEGDRVEVRFRKSKKEQGR